MNTKYLFLAAFALTAMPAAAQETYENTKLIESDLNGTARYVGMGGAMDALGADISTINSNPAGIGLFRRSNMSVSFGAVSQEGGKNFANGKIHNASFDQIGFVWSRPTGDGSYFNLAFNYHKGRNFDYILDAAGSLRNSSQNGITFLKGIGGVDKTGTSTYNVDRKGSGPWFGTDIWTSQLDNLYYNNFNLDANGAPAWNSASGFQMNRANTGYIGSYDLNLSGNIQDRVYLGLTFGIKDVHYRGVAAYTENLVDNDGNGVGSVTVNDDRRITGSGFNVVLGAIYRPIETSPFRIGLSIATPTWYDLTTKNFTSFENHTNYESSVPGYTTSEAYDFKASTPWKFGLSLGHTIGNYLALGAGVDYADYSYLGTRVIENSGYGYDYYYDEYYSTESSYVDDNMNDHTKKTLKGVATFKLGAEIKPVPELSIRAGYNYVSPMFEETGFKDLTIDSYGTNYASQSDYTNWKATNRLTLGLGYAFKNFTIDLAYQFSKTSGDFYPFESGYGEFKYFNTDNNKLETENIAISSNPVSVDNKRSQFLMTLGYKF